MKQSLLFFIVFFYAIVSSAQVTYINITGHNIGSGSNNLFNKYITTTSDAYINFEVYASGLLQSDACGTKTQARVVLRTTSDNDPSSVVTSLPIYVNAICEAAAKTSNNDKYYVNLKTAIGGKPGRYSIEIQADVVGGTGMAYDRSTAATTWNFACPPAYYLTGASGATGNYYTPPSTCNYGGLSDPIGGSTVDNMTQINNALKYFTVGDATNYRDMVVFGTTFYDMKDGKFGPGNPRVPASLNGKATIPAIGVCPVVAAPSLIMGAEINTFKIDDGAGPCAADVTGAKMYYRVYKASATPPAYLNFSINYKDACPTSINGPENNVFILGGSCQNQDNVLDQRWQNTTGSANILPAAFSIADIGLWNIDFYTETYLKDCSGALSTQTSTINNTTFTVNDPNALGSACAFVLPIAFKNFSVLNSGFFNKLNWEVDANNSFTNFEVLRSYDGFNFEIQATINASAFIRPYTYNDAGAALNMDIIYYKIKATNNMGNNVYSNIVKIVKSKSNVLMHITKNLQSINVIINNVPKDKYQLLILNVDGKLIMQKELVINTNGTFAVNVPIKNAKATRIYIGVLKNSRNEKIAAVTFLY